MAKDNNKETKTAAKQAASPKEDSKKLKELQKKIEELEEKAARDKEDYLKLMAEFETFRRRSAEDRLNMVSTAAADTIKGPVDS